MTLKVWLKSVFTYNFNFIAYLGYSYITFFPHRPSLRFQVKSSQVNTLPKAKSKTRSKQNKDMHKFRILYSEWGVPLPVLTSGGEWVGVRACKNATRVPPSLCDATQTSDQANPPPCACRTRLRDVCSTRPLRTVGRDVSNTRSCYYRQFSNPEVKNPL